jgi:hypothetical protein
MLIVDSSIENMSHNCCCPKLRELTSHDLPLFVHISCSYVVI